MTSVRWLPVEGWPYEVSSDGQVRRRAPARGATVGLILKQAKRGSYYGVTLSQGGVVHSADVHVLVCSAFHGPRPDGEQARHLDGDTSHNSEGNLMWGTPSMNAEDKRRHGTLLVGNAHPRTKITDDEYGRLLRTWDAAPRGYRKTAAFVEAAMLRLNVSRGFVEDAIYGRVRSSRIRERMVA